MSRTIKYTVSDEEFELIRHAARSKGMTPSGLTKTAVISHIGKYPPKGVFAILDKKLNGKGKTS